MIIPGILEKTLEDIKKKIEIVDNSVELVQIDVVDNVLVTGETFLDLEKLDSINTKCDLEIHLMVENPHKYVLKLEKASKYVSQVESDHVQDFIIKSKELGYKTGLSISPDTPNHVLDPYLEQIDYIQFMGVIPGAQGKPFEPKILEKLKDFKLLHPRIETQVDGHMNLKNIIMIKPLDITHFIVGSDIFNDVDPISKLKVLQDNV
ncbi:hypothetical protein ACFLZK_02555 [Patescibacteria group bacterium]